MNSLAVVTYKLAGREIVAMCATLKCANRVIRLIADLHPGDKEVASDDKSNISSNNNNDEVSNQGLLEKHDRLE